MNAKAVEDVDLPDPYPELTRSDRCDRCGAQAYFRYLFKTGDLLFCRHHQKTYKASLDSMPVVSLFSAQESG